MSLLLETKNLNVTLARDGRRFHVAKGIDLSVNRGEILGLIGESGCGKTLTTLSLTGLLPKHATLNFSQYSFDGKFVSPPREPDELRWLRAKNIANIFQEPASHLNPLFSVGDQITETIRFHDACSPEQSRRAMRERLQEVGLKQADRISRSYAHQLSGGMNQRVMIALALSCRPKLLVADEPTTALDTATKIGIIDLIKTLARDKNLGVIWISHDISLMETFADRIAVMYAGRIAEEGPTRVIFASAAHPYTRGLIACLPDHAPSKRFSTISGEVPDLLGLPQGCAFHPRCPHRIKQCAGDEPEFTPLSSTHKSRCYLTQKI